MQRRVLLGVAGTAVLGALALVDLGSLVPKPSKPLLFYLTPLVRVEVRERCCNELGASSKHTHGRARPDLAWCFPTGAHC